MPTCKTAVDIVLPTFNGLALVGQCLAAFEKCFDVGCVTVVDDASADGTVDMLRRDFPDVGVVARKANGGFSASVNDGIRATNREFMALLNNDVECTPGFQDALLPLFEDDSVFAVTPRIVLPSRGGIDEGCKTGFWHHGMFFTDQRQDVTEVTPVLYSTGCAVVYRRSMLEQLGGFDEAYSPFYWEDVDLGYRAWKRGWKSFYQPASVVYHQHCASISRLSASYTRRIRARNSMLFIHRNIEDARLLSAHRRWQALVLLRRLASGDRASALGWKDAFLRRHESAMARRHDSQSRVMSDLDIFDVTGIRY